jgi:hypothetical protein
VDSPQVGGAVIVLAEIALAAGLWIRFSVLNAIILWPPTFILLLAEVAARAFDAEWRPFTWRSFFTIVAVGLTVWMTLEVDPVFLLFLGPVAASLLLWSYRNASRRQGVGGTFLLSARTLRPWTSGSSRTPPTPSATPGPWSR